MKKYEVKNICGKWDVIDKNGIGVNTHGLLDIDAQLLCNTLNDNERLKELIAGYKEMIREVENNG